MNKKNLSDKTISEAMVTVNGYGNQVCGVRKEKA